MNAKKCLHCPLLAEVRECPGEKNTAVCDRADITSPRHNPGIIEQIMNFGKAVVQHVAAGMPMVSDEQKNARLAICQACEHFRDGGRCHLCGCGLGVKAGWAGESCPIGKWLAEPHRV